MKRVPVSVRLAVLGLCVATALVLTGAAARAQDASIDITVQDKQFQPAEVKAPADKRIVIRVINRDANPMEFESHALKVEKVVAGKGEGIVRVGPLKPGRYDFFDDFNKKNKGTLVVE